MRHIRSTAALVFVLCAAQLGAQTVLDVWIGTSRSKLSKGVYHATLNTQNGRMTDPELAAEIEGPGFLAMHPDRSTLYALGKLGGKDVIAAYRIEGKEGKRALKPLNSAETGDGGSAHLCVDKTARTLVSAQYGGGSVSVYALNKDGSIRERTQVIEHSGPVPSEDRRQRAPHPHWSGFSPDNRFVFVPDLGLNRVIIYKLDAAASRLTPHGHTDVHPGAGPRHMKFHVNGKWAYLLNEFDLTVTVFDYDAGKGTLTAKQTVAAVPKAEYEKEKARSGSEIRVHPGGRFVYSANRGHDTITAYEVNQTTGKLTVIERENVRGATPRNFNLDPGGRWLLAGGQASHSLASFEVDQQSGELTFNQHAVHVPSPICVLFQPE
ncbi:MAG: lactonase family protein [Verrucomicrobiae bacterium]|nr:lactonase family protein [Verrucomicrobiae bacterium]